MFEPKSEDSWVQFYANFSKNNRSFVNELSKKHKTLTNTQFKVCAFIRAGYSTNDIAKNLNITKRSAEAHSFRLRKKFNLDHAQSLVTYLNIID
jgi:DNA-binding NarL/FixJ family response regulator